MIVMIGSAATPLMTRAANPNVAVVDTRPGGSFATPDKRGSYNTQRSTTPIRRMQSATQAVVATTTPGAGFIRRGSS